MGIYFMLFEMEITEGKPIVGTWGTWACAGLAGMELQPIARVSSSWQDTKQDLPCFRLPVWEDQSDLGEMVILRIRI